MGEEGRFLPADRRDVGGPWGTQGPAREAVRDLPQHQGWCLECKGAGLHCSAGGLEDLRLVLLAGDGAWSEGRPIWA